MANAHRLSLSDYMMTITEIVFLSVALAMDCFTVSTVSGVILRQRIWSVILVTAFFFGLFQALMPLIGWLATSHFAHYIETFDHWVAFALLAFLGIRMIVESGRPEEEQHFNPRKLSTQLVQAVATSIDALAIGISMAMTGYETVTSLVLPLIIIGIGSFLFSIVGFLLGIHFGKGIRRRLKPELLGGVILLIIGFRILWAHLS